MNIVTTVIKSRHSVRKFKPDPVSDLIIKDALECAAQSPTAINIQHWLFGVLKNKETLSKIAAIVDHGEFISVCSICFAVFGEKKEIYYLEDCCAATGNIILVLQAHGVMSCWVAGEKKTYAEQIRQMLGVPEKYSFVSLIAAGYPTEITLTCKKEIKDVVFNEKYE
ncbi:MAG: nitroreductase family protein [Methanomicrobiales archaeon]